MTKRPLAIAAIPLGRGTQLRKCVNTRPCHNPFNVFCFQYVHKRTVAVGRMHRPTNGIRGASVRHRGFFFTSEPKVHVSRGRVIRENWGSTPVLGSNTWLYLLVFCLLYFKINSKVNMWWRRNQIQNHLLVSYCVCGTINKDLYVHVSNMGVYNLVHMFVSGRLQQTPNFMKGRKICITVAYLTCPKSWPGHRAVFHSSHCVYQLRSRGYTARNDRIAWAAEWTGNLRRNGVQRNHALCRNRYYVTSLYTREATPSVQ